jgi:ABC-type nickel/cobalt efflux system permease component RcnA
LKNVILIFKIIASSLIVSGIFALYIIGIAVSASSHNISMKNRESAIQNGNIALILDPILIVCIWLPWKKWFSSNVSYNKKDENE